MVNGKHWSAKISKTGTVYFVLGFWMCDSPKLDEVPFFHYAGEFVKPEKVLSECGQKWFGLFLEKL